MDLEVCDALGHVLIDGSQCSVYEFSDAELHDKAVADGYFNLGDAEMMSLEMSDEIFAIVTLVGTERVYDFESGVYIELENYPSHYIV
jgi:hypothetical protein